MASKVMPESIAARRVHAKLGTSGPNLQGTAAVIALLNSSAILKGGLQYKPLDLDRGQIRLFKVIGITPTGLVGRLHHFDLEAAPSYRALSYTWGQPSPTGLIVINEQTCTIRANLYQFLQVYGARHINEHIWIDQLCIDQSSIPERNHQVQLMSEIYQGASEVLIWLGPTKHCFRPSKDKEDGCCDSSCEETHSPSDKCIWLKNLVQNDYWRRMWIVQEVLLARSLQIYYGHASLNWASVREHIRQNQEFSPPLQFWYLNKQVQQGFRFSSFDLPDAIRHCSKSRCQDARDKVYALQGLIPENSRLQIDYNKKTELVFFEAAAALLCYGYTRHTRRSESPAECSLDSHNYWELMPSAKDVVDAIWHLACELGFRIIAEERGINLGIDFYSLRPLLYTYDEAHNESDIDSSIQKECFELLVEEIRYQVERQL